MTPKKDNTTREKEPKNKEGESEKMMMIDDKGLHGKKGEIRKVKRKQGSRGVKAMRLKN